MSVDTLDQRLNRGKPVSPAQIIDENGNFIPISYATPSGVSASPTDDAARETRFQAAVKNMDRVGVMDEGTPDEIAGIFGLPTEAEASLQEIQNPQSLLQDAQYMGAVQIDVDIASQSLSVTYPAGYLRDIAISSARRGYHTKTGCFRRPYLERMHYSRKYDNSPMPHSIFYYGGFAIHGTYEQRYLGRPASHGCVRVSPRDAAVLYEIVQTYGASNTTICVQ